MYGAVGTAKDTHVKYIPLSYPCETSRLHTVKILAFASGLTHEEQKKIK